MIKLLKARLQNFQKHSDLTVDFNEDITIFTGKTQAGKSCIRRAIDWVIFCLSIKDTDLIKEGTKGATVTLTFNNGVEVEKTRTKSINRYILRRPNEDEQVFDKFGKNVPEEIRNAIGMSKIEIDNESLNLNIAEQLTLPFLLDKSPSFRAKLFNKLTGNELLDTLFKKCNKESLRLLKDTKTTEELLEKQENDVVEISAKYSKDKKKLDAIKEIYVDLKKKHDKHKELTVIFDALQEIAKSQKEVEKNISSIVILNPTFLINLKEKIDTYKKYNQFMIDITNIDNELAKIGTTNHVVLDVNFDDLRKRLELINKLTEISNSIDLIDSDIVKNEKSLIVIKEEIKKNAVELKEIWKKLDNVCPLCKGKKPHKEKVA